MRSIQLKVPLGSTANKHGRVIGTNVTGGDDTFPGILGTGIVKVFDDNENTYGVAIQDKTGEETLFWYNPSELSHFCVSAE